MSRVPLQVPPPSLSLYTNESVGSGSAPIGCDGLRGLVPGRKRGAHQCAGGKSSSAGSGCRPASAVGVEFRPDERRRLGCCIRVAWCVSWHSRSPCGPSGIQFACWQGTFRGGRTFWPASSAVPTKFFTRNGPIFRRCSRGSAASSAVPISTCLLLKGTQSLHSCVPGSGPAGLEAGCLTASVGPSVRLCLPAVCSSRAGSLQSSRLNMPLVSSGESAVAPGVVHRPAIAVDR